MPFKCDLALQNIPLLKQPFQTQPEIEIEDATWGPQYNLPAIRTNKRRALSLQEVGLDGWFLILHIILEIHTNVNHAQVLYEFCISFLHSWIDVLNLKQRSWNLRALQNGTHVRASILNTGGYGAPGKRRLSTPRHLGWVGGEKGQHGVQLAAPGPVL